MRARTSHRSLRSPISQGSSERARTVAGSAWRVTSLGTFSDHRTAMVEMDEVDVGIREFHQVADDLHVVWVGVRFEHCADVQIPGAQLVELARLGSRLQPSEGSRIIRGSPRRGRSASSMLLSSRRRGSCCACHMPYNAPHMLVSDKDHPACADRPTKFFAPSRSPDTSR